MTFVAMVNLVIGCEAFLPDAPPTMPALSQSPKPPVFSASSERYFPKNFSDFSLIWSRGPDAQSHGSRPPLNRLLLSSFSLGILSLTFTFLMIPGSLLPMELSTVLTNKTHFSVVYHRMMSGLRCVMVIWLGNLSWLSQFALIDHFLGLMFCPVWGNSAPIIPPLWTGQAVSGDTGVSHLPRPSFSLWDLPPSLAPYHATTCNNPDPRQPCSHTWYGRALPWPFHTEFLVKLPW